ncbi:putative O-glycosylation ligase, exosortase A system-associated [Paucibacter sp. KBW04]|uniref:putative O-glycosylation ligase, exosortase A system-associated n=1 Tax=Paucibacter sp. KBW04 TaxID=2153361 RepID=UPI000F58C60B|nr:putative O-glycosylation ligase, exosortase A system-associated [Paucibacter sp. KBW04]RQO58694.1 putative O-glycosylation ligase, exosortase A system-associated [Paucibacter sp. KBW04]
MRDLILGGVLLWLMIKALRQPWIGIMGWTWVSIMNPHTYSWVLNSLPVAAAMAGSTLIGIFATKDKIHYFVSRETGVLMVFMLWMCITLPFSFFFDRSFDLWVRVMKIDFMILVALAVLYTRQHIFTLAWVLVGSLGFYGVKGGLFTFATGGSYRVWGPEGSYIEGNNEVALALVMTIPLMRFLQLNSDNKWIRRGLGISMLLCAASALGSQSRVALLAIAAMTLLLWWRGKNKAQMGLVLLVLGIALIAFMPDSWTERMSTIKTYEQDTSAGGRINAWWMAFNLASHNFFGGGFMVSAGTLFALYAPDPLDVHAAHSIYFMVLGEHGFVGLFIFLLLWFFVWRSAGRLYREGRKKPETQWFSDLGAMCQVSLVGYLVGGAFLSLSYYDLPYNIMILVVLACRLMDGKVKEPPPTAPKPGLDLSRLRKPA